jgi:hypothetical protein
MVAKSNFEVYVINAYCSAVEQAVRDNNLKKVKGILSEWLVDSTVSPPGAQ